MRHLKDRRKLGRVTAHRYSMLRNLATSLLRSERVITTVPKAKEVRPLAERLITIAKQETLHARRRVMRVVRDKEVVQKLFDTLSARFASRPGGYTRIIRVGHRRGDGAPLAIIELLDSEWYRLKAEREKKKKEKKKAAKAGAPAEKTAKEESKEAVAEAKADAEKPAQEARAKEKKPKAEKKEQGKVTKEGKAQEKKGRPRAK